MKKIFGSKKILIGLIVLAMGFVLFGINNHIKEEKRIEIIRQKVNNAKHGTFVDIGLAKVSRRGHIAITLKDEKVLLAGGGNGKKAAIYDPKTYQFKPIGTPIGLPMSDVGMQGVLLSDGNALLTSSGCLNLYNYKKNLFSVLKDNVASPHNAGLTVLNNGKVLITRSGDDTCRIYDPKTGSFSPAGNMIKNRTNYATTLLPNGKVLITGGFDIKENNGAWPSLKTAEIYDPITNKFSKTGNMNYKHALHTATLLPKGKVLIVGGYPNAELYDYKTGKFYLSGKTTVTRSRFHTATLLKNGNVLIVGGRNSETRHGQLDSSGAEIYDPINYNENLAEIYDLNENKFYRTGFLNHPATEHRATLLDDGKVLITGGFTAGRRAELYIP
jgi:WD40 repeat protein